MAIIGDDFSTDVHELWQRVRAKACLAYGPWRVKVVDNGIVPQNLKTEEGWNSVPHYVHSKPAYVVHDLKGRAVAVVADRGMADLIAMVPDLCDPLLRPASGFTEPTFTSALTGDPQDMPETPLFVGATTTDETWSTGYQNGFFDGEKLGFAVAKAEDTDDG